MNIKRLIPLSLFAFLCACQGSKEDETQLGIMLQSKNTYTTSEAGKKILYDIKCFSNNSTIEKFSITSYDDKNGLQEIFEEQPNKSSYTLQYQYTVPVFPEDSTSVRLNMAAWDALGNKFNLNCYITVIGGDVLLPEQTGIVMRVGQAFSIAEPSLVFASALADSAAIDVFTYSVPESVNISREWRTNTDVSFARNNSFNYAQATAISVENAFNTSVRDKYITNLQPNDIILLAKNNSIFGVLQVTDVVDNEGSENDYYRFNIKTTYRK
jgi:hypothetical protein